jgi:hypothetical protein
MKDGLSKLNLLLEIERDIPEDLEDELTQGARTWFFTGLKPALSCFRSHFNSDKDLFVQTWGNFKYAKFECKLPRKTDSERICPNKVPTRRE